MNSGFFAALAEDSGERNMARLDLRDGDARVLIISDLHMGAGPRDDLAHNGKLLITLLERYYYPGGWYLVLNGDVEELQRFSLSAVQERWQDLYRVFGLFAAGGRFFRTLGNHDEELVFEKNYPYPLYQALRIETAQLPLYVYHGHQSSRMYTDFNVLARGLVRYILKPFGIKNISSARGSRRRFSVEKEAYDFSMRNACISIIGHTHRALFESLSRFEFIKFEIERLCRDYPSSEGREKERIAGEVAALRSDLGKLKRSERRDGTRHSLYGDDLPVPCLFNSGSAINRRGINALELTNDDIALVYWFTEGEGWKFVTRRNYSVEKLRETPYRRVVLNRDRLEYIKARMELLGPAVPAPPSAPEDGE
ncbi:MAG: metallophosphoesterase [Treponema sp.]|jgi:predicted phosphodiesterase|nr:metallophosphoesterase [Treponema sp.]